MVYVGNAGVSNVKVNVHVSCAGRTRDESDWDCALNSGEVDEKIVAPEKLSIIERELNPEGRGRSGVCTDVKEKKGVSELNVTSVSELFVSVASEIV